MVSRKKPANKVKDEEVNAKRARTTDDSEDTAEENWNNAATTSNAKEKIVAIKQTSNVENNGDDNGTPEVDEDEPKKVEWKRLNEFADFLIQLTESNPDLRKRKGLSQLDTLLTPEQREQWPDFESLSHAFRSFYQKSASVKMVRLPTALLSFRDFMQDDGALNYHPEYPKQPLSAHMFLVRKLGLGIGCGSMASRLQDPSDVLALAAIQDAEKDKTRYYGELRTFLEKYRDKILPSHVACVERKLHNHEKELIKALNPESTPKKSKSVSKLVKRTAYDYYKQSKKHKFLDLPPEEREAKLKRHFEKLDDDKRRIFEDLAINLE